MTAVSNGDMSVKCGTLQIDITPMAYSISKDADDEGDYACPGIDWD